MRHHFPPKEAGQVVFFGRGDEAVGDEDVVQSVVVEVADLRAPGPPSVAHHALRNVLELPQFGKQVEAQVVPLKQEAFLGDISHERVHPPAVVHVAE